MKKKAVPVPRIFGVSLNRTRTGFSGSIAGTDVELHRHGESYRCVVANYTMMFTESTQELCLQKAEKWFVSWMRIVQRLKGPWTPKREYEFRLQEATEKVVSVRNEAFKAESQYLVERDAIRAAAAKDGLVGFGEQS